MTWLLLLVARALATPPTDLDGLVELALARDPSIAALGADADAARSRARSLRVPMDPQVMVGVDALGAPMDAADPTMGMVGVTQMFRGPGEGRALADRQALDATRAEADGDRVAADLRVRLWQAAARIGTLGEELALVDEQVRSATALREVAFARYAAGAAVGGMGGGMAGMSAMPSMEGGMDMGARPPLVVPRGGSGGGMSGMGGMSGGGRGGGTALSQTSPDAMSGGPQPSVAPTPSSGGLAAVLDLDARIARVEADRLALDAELGGAGAVLAVLVGDEAAAAVAANPTAYLGTPGAAPPELQLAAVDVALAQADLRVARTSRRPDVMVQVAERVMPEGMLAGTDVALGVEIPLWGGRGRTIDAALADLEAAEGRRASVARDLDLAARQAQASLAAARARAEALEGTALPRARAAWDATLALFAAGGTGQTEVVRAWENWIAVGRDAIVARRELELRAAVLARVEAP